MKVVFDKIREKYYKKSEKSITNFDWRDKYFFLKINIFKKYLWVNYLTIKYN